MCSLCIRLRFLSILFFLLKMQDKQLDVTKERKIEKKFIKLMQPQTIHPERYDLKGAVLRLMASV